MSEYWGIYRTFDKRWRLATAEASRADIKETLVQCVHGVSTAVSCAPQMEMAKWIGL
jgi:hypothetical protein